MDIDRDLDALMAASDWQGHAHQAVFSYESEFTGELYVDGKPVRVGYSGGSAWVSLDEARHVAQRLGVALQVA